MTMEENYVGYLLNSLETDEHEAVAQHLREQPDQQARLDLLKKVLAPLELDREPPDVPAGLWVRTLSRLAEHQCSLEEAPRATLKLPSRTVGGGRPVWRRADLLVAASIFLCVGLLIPPGLGYLHYQHDRAACQDNMRSFYGALSTYSDQNEGRLPDVTAIGASKGVAGMVVPILYESGHLSDDFQHTCPGKGKPFERTTVSVEKLKNMDDEQFKQVAPQLSGCYAYTLGYRENGKYHPHVLDRTAKNIPVLGDCPPQDVQDAELNSPNHGGRGQNVLFADGHTEFRTSRVNDAQDDLFLNHDKQVKAGKNRFDAVLGDSQSRP
ncbi:MAG: hypothetical protein AB7K24_08920 [Gemmataceae bacterium]